jgi:hypothetical protein
MTITTAPSVPAYRKILTRGELVSPSTGLTGGELRAITEYSQDAENPFADELYGFWWQAQHSLEINLEDPDMVAASVLMVTLGLLTEERAASINEGILE